MHKRARFDAKQLNTDMDARGWLAIDLARAANVSHSSVWRFLKGEQTPRMALKLATALGQPLSRYIRARKSVAA
jgi:transcriptional regulator with XRE-family HTH domain